MRVWSSGYFRACSLQLAAMCGTAAFLALTVFRIMHESAIRAASKETGRFCVR